jgi:hypothetical protein
MAERKRTKGQTMIYKTYIYIIVQVTFVDTDTLLLKQKKLSVLDITLFFRIRTQVKSLVLLASTYTWVPMRYIQHEPLLLFLWKCALYFVYKLCWFYISTQYLDRMSTGIGWWFFNVTFNNMSVAKCISWRSVQLVEETGVPGENHWPVARHWQTLSHNVTSRTPWHERDSNSLP